MINQMEKKNIFLEVFGWYGMIAMLAAYAFISLHVVDSFNVWYQLLNLTAALGITCVSFYKKVYQPAVLNLIWSVISIIALVQILIK
jgi:hypothetical protein